MLPMNLEVWSLITCHVSSLMSSLYVTCDRFYGAPHYQSSLLIGALQSVHQLGRGIAKTIGLSSLVTADLLVQDVMAEIDAYATLAVQLAASIEGNKTHKSCFVRNNQRLTKVFGTNKTEMLLAVFSPLC